MRFTVAIDGPAAAGKGTVSKGVARYFGFAHLDTGLLYRAVGRRMLNGLDPVEAAKSLTSEELEEADLRTPEVALAASRVAAAPQVRAALIDFQRGFARREGGTVLDGRDIGTVICPEAEVKLYVTATPEVRAERRYLELSAKGLARPRAEVLAEVMERDARDRGRTDAPLRAAEDAIRIDTSHMALEAAIAAAVAAVKTRYQTGPAPSVLRNNNA